MVREQTRVLRVITRLNIGGPARQALLLTKALKDEFRTTLVAGASQRDEGELHDSDVPVTKVSLVRPIRPLMDARATLAIRTLLKSSGARILHTHMAKAGTVGRAAARTLGTAPRTVHTFHGHVLEGYFRPELQRAFVEVERRLARKTDVLIAVSSEIRDQLLDLGIGNVSQYEVIPLGFVLDPFLEVQSADGMLRKELGLISDTPLVGVIGRLAPIKDHETLFRAIADLDGVHLAVLGDGEMLPRLRRLATQLMISERVHFLGWRHDVAACVGDMDVVGLTSRNEGSPVALIEALACARPVVATNVGGVPSVVKDGVTGYLVAPRDPLAVARRLGELLRDGQLRERMGIAGRQDVAQRYSKDRLVADIRSLYKDLL